MNGMTMHVSGWGTWKRRAFVCVTLPLLIVFYCWVYVPIAGFINALFKAGVYTTHLVKTAKEVW